MRTALVRTKPRIIAGVCSGLSAHVGWSVTLIRVGMVAASFVFGAGILFYLWLWWFVPLTGQTTSRAQNPVPKILAAFTNPGSRAVAVGAAALVVAAVLIIGALGLAVPWQILIPGVGILGGMVLLWTQLDTSPRAALLKGGTAGPWGAIRLVLGVLLVAVGAVVLALGGGGWNLILPALLAVVAVLIGIGLVVAPRLSRMWQDLQSERAARVRESERAEIGAHLHDSVLQTLAMIQRRSDSNEVKALARSQERQLREWIYRDISRDPGQLVAQLKQSAAAIESEQAVQVEVVAVGDAPLTSAVQAAAYAASEAMLNAARHAKTAVSVYVEARPDLVELFIKDRGPGFDVKNVPPGRLGVKESIIGRMRRNGGTAYITSGPTGTEVALKMPLRGTKED